MPLLSADTPAHERRAPLPLESDAFWYGVGGLPKPPSSGLSYAEWAHLTAAIILLGVSLTSLILAFGSSTGPQEDVASELQAVLGEAAQKGIPAPSALLVVGLEQETLWLTNTSPWPSGSGAPPWALWSSSATLPGTLQGLRSYWVVGLEDAMPDHPVAGYSLDGVITRSGWRLERWTLPPKAQKNKNLSELLPLATARYRPHADPDAAGYPCDRQWFGRRVCGPNPWNWFGIEELIVRGERAVCIWAHPLLDHDLVITFPALDLAANLKGRFALSDHVAESPNGGQVTLRIEANGEEKLTKTVLNKRGWQPFTAPSTRGEQVALSFIISATHDGQRHFCFQADVPAAPLGVGALEAAKE